MPEELPKRKRLFHTIPPWVDQSELYFVTINCKQRGVRQLTKNFIGKTVLKSALFHNNNGNWFCRLLVLMPDHLHMLVSFPPEKSMETLINSWKGYLAKQCQVQWQRGFFDHRIRGWESLDEKAEYIRENPIRANLVKSFEEWPWQIDLVRR